jgi:hypothetical protein
VALDIAAEDLGPATAVDASEVGAYAVVVPRAGPSHGKVGYAVEDSD